jgi:hypothetical protein
MEKIMEYAEREAMKTEAWKVINSKDANIHAKAWGVLKVIEAHYWRAREDLEAMPKAAQRRIHGKRYCPGHLLDIDVYTRHWLAANKSIPISYEVIQHVKSEFGYEPEESKFLHPGQTSYMLPNAMYTAKTAI